MEVTFFGMNILGIIVVVLVIGGGVGWFIVSNKKDK